MSIMPGDTPPPKWVARDVREKILDWATDEPGRIIVTLWFGWAFEPHTDESVASHVHGYDKSREAVSEVREWARPCMCGRCQRGIAQFGKTPSN